LAIDQAGHVYGTTIYGGNLGSGTVFELAKVDGEWQETVIHNFGAGDGIYPYGPLAMDAAGNLYGTTFQSLVGNVGGAGIVFELSTTTPSVWQESVLHNFVSPGDGGNPYSGVAIDGAGHVYGTTYAGGGGSGVVFEVTLPTVTILGTLVNVSAGATTGNTSTITLTPSGGFTGSVILTAATTSSPTGAQDPPTLSFGATSPVSISGTSAVTATLTITTTAPTSAALAYPAQPGVRWYAASGMTLAFGLFFGICIPERRRSWRTWLGVALLVILAGGILACGGGGGGGGSGGGGTSNPGTTPGTYTVTVTGTSGSTTATSTVTLTVQ
jgi:hypothetical protein